MLLAGVLTALLASAADAQVRPVTPGGGIGRAPIIVPPPPLTPPGGGGLLKPGLGGTLLPPGPSLPPPPGGGNGGSNGGGNGGDNWGKVMAPPPAPPTDCEARHDCIEQIDLVSVHTAATAGTQLMIVIFAPDTHIREAAMRALLENLYKAELRQTAKLAAAAMLQSRQALEGQLAAVQHSWLSPFRWQKKAELRRNIAVIRETEDELAGARQQAADEARQQAQSWQPAPGWSRHGRIETHLGHAFQQALSIQSMGWGGN